MIDLLLSLYFAWRNSVRARIKGQNGLVWGFITFMIFLAFEIIGFAISVFGFYHIAPTQTAVMEFALHAPWAASLFVLFCGIGGYLLIRFILDRMAGQNRNDDPQV